MDSEPEKPKLSKKEYIAMLKRMIHSYDNLPGHAMINPVTHYDFCSLLILLLAFFNEERKED